MDAFLYVSVQAKIPAEEVYGEILDWKGVVGAREQGARRIYRQLQQSGNDQALKLATDLAKATQALAALSRERGARDAERPFRIEELSGTIESLQKQLAAMSVEGRKQLEEQHRTPDDLRKALPADSVLIDLLSYQNFVPPDGKAKKGVWQSTLVAFVVRPKSPVERVDLGPVEPLEKAIASWRRTFGRKTADYDPGAVLGQLIFHPLAGFAKDSKILLISPDGLTAPIPWGALPGSKPGTYLIDDFAVAVVPIPRLLPELTSSDRRARDTAARPSLLLVGDVDFGAEPGSGAFVASDRSAPRGDQPMHWSPLPGTRAEVAAIKASFRNRFADVNPTELASDRATKSAVCSQAGKYQYLHFSTHGFFAAPQIRSALAGNTGSSHFSTGSQHEVTGFHPGLLSGLVLAGANRREDGILTALEVEELDLSHVELATLSACETGLGQTAGGEGLLGLQRAFQSAGAKTVVAGLWKVPDKATQLLMSRFYDNLWQKRMTRLDALREAQRWMIREAPKEGDLLRGLDVDSDTQQRLNQSGTLSPFYWAAFVLSGDWW